MSDSAGVLVNVEIQVIEAGGIVDWSPRVGFLTKTYELPGVPRVGEWFELPHPPGVDGIEVEIRRVRWLVRPKSRFDAGGAKVAVRLLMSNTSEIGYLNVVIGWMVEEDGWKAW
jgi:hypothetical protein